MLARTLPWTDQAPKRCSVGAQPPITSADLRHKGCRQASRHQGGNKGTARAACAEPLFFAPRATIEGKAPRPRRPPHRFPQSEVFRPSNWPTWQTPAGWEVYRRPAISRSEGLGPRARLARRSERAPPPLSPPERRPRQGALAFHSPIPRRAVPGLDRPGARQERSQSKRRSCAHAASAQLPACTRSRGGRRGASGERLMLRSASKRR